MIIVVFSFQWSKTLNHDDYQPLSNSQLIMQLPESWRFTALTGWENTTNVIRGGPMQHSINPEVQESL